LSSLDWLGADGEEGVMFDKEEAFAGLPELIEVVKSNNSGGLP
jgi:hypothetical protein